MKYDDGYVAYLNGDRGRPQERPCHAAWNSAATAQRTDAQASVWEDVNISADIDQLVAGTNVLAIQAMNYAGRRRRLPGSARTGADVLPGAGRALLRPAHPGEANIEEYWLTSRIRTFSVDRGFYDAPFNVQITTATADAQIYYTTDGTEPSRDQRHALHRADPHRQDDRPTGRGLRTLLCPLRRRHADLYLPGRGDPAAGRPRAVDGYHRRRRDTGPKPGGQSAPTANYQVDPDVVNNPEYAGTIKDDLKAIPDLSLVMDLADLSDPPGHLLEPGGQGACWERPASVELIDGDGTQAVPDRRGIPDPRRG